MSALAFVLSGPDPAGTARAVLAIARPGDEMVIALPPPAASAMAGLRQAAGGRAVVWQGPESAEAGLPPPGLIALRPMALGTACPAGVAATLALQHARAGGVIWLPQDAPVAPGVAESLRAGLAAGCDLAFGPDGLTALARGLLRRAVLPLPHDPPGLEASAFFWRARLAARRIAGDPPPAPPPAQFGPPPANPLALFDPLEALAADTGRGTAWTEARRWLLAALARSLATLPEAELWALAEACRPLALARGAAFWRELGDPAAQALAVLAQHPPWQAVAAWQGARRAGRMPGSAAEEAIATARAQWRRLRAGGGAPC